MQQTPGNSSQQHSWGSSEGINGADQGINGFDPSPWQQPLSNRWAPIGPTTGMPTLRSIMQEEQQAVLQSHGPQAQSLNNTGFHSYQYADQGRPRAPPGLTLPPAIQQQPPQQQQQTRQRSAGFYMNSQNRDEEESVSAAGPVTNSWAQLVRSPAVDAANISQQHGFVDLRMATEAFRDAFSATAPPMHGPPEVPQDPLMLEALKGPINHVTGRPLNSPPPAVLCPLNCIKWCSV